MTARFKLLLIVNVLLLVFINMTTIKQPAISGNGNPALLFIFPLFPLAFWLAYEWTKWLPTVINTSKKRIAVITGSIAVFVVGMIRTVYEIRTFKSHFLEEYRQEFADSPFIEMDVDYINIMSDGLTIFTNTLYFNFTTFLMFLALISLNAVWSKPSSPAATEDQHVS